MHQCLTIAEVLDHIFAHIPVSGNRVSLATVCHAFSEPALKILWRDVSLWTLVVHTIPTSILDVSEITMSRENGSTTVECVARLIRPPRPEEMDRLVYYASFVRSLKVCGSYRKGKYMYPMKLDPSIFDALSFLQRPTLPSLRCLSISYLPGWMCGYIDIFLVPDIRRLVFSMPANDQTCIPLMAQIRRSCEHVEALELRNLSHSQEEFQRVHEFIGSFGHIRQLDYMHIYPDDALLHMLAGIPTLEDLKLSLSALGLDMPILGLQLRHARCFQFLKMLEVTSPKLSYIEPLLSMVQSAPLEHLALKCTVLKLTSPSVNVSDTLLTRVTLSRLEQLHIQSTDFLEDSLSTVSATCSPSSLKCLDIEHTYDATGPAIPVDSMIRPLLAFHRIEHLRLTSRKTFKISDKTLEEFALSWPHLKCVYIVTGTDRNASSITFKGIANLAFHCPYLEHITLPVNVTRAPTIEELGCQNAHGNSSVKELDFRSSPLPVECIEEVASVLRHVFPAFQTISIGPSIFEIY
ncbi:hypothetical protein OE88DRAFT_1661789 [Heliocybe sulcata]|uniref:F-box domain-containing protein n=1 Tax=Heliocybe sulcata TaxID=5364 RepID=A0A5C3N280_9AGAM|nr:hypothetical protein OE88DRAFT_1661789 [Heliocybe sulcata]